MNKEQKVTLYNLADNLVELDLRIEEILADESLSEEESNRIAEEILEVYLENEGNFKEKLNNCVRYIHELEGLSKIRKEEAKRLSELAKSSEQRATRLREYIGAHLLKIGRNNIELSNSRLNLRRKQPELILNCEVEELPEMYKRIKVEADRIALRKALKKDPTVLNGMAYLEDTEKYSLVIK